jgi:hypothetical protein
MNDGNGIRSGYAYLYTGSARTWRVGSSEKWEIVMLSPERGGATAYLGSREIDGTKCRVYRCADGSIVAQTAIG